MSDRTPVEVFDEWAKIGKDKGMEKGHASAVDEMLTAALKEVALLGEKFTAIDAGCGNGWVVRNLKMMPFCSGAIGVDGAPTMIARAKEIDPDGEYYLSDLTQWNPNEKVNLVHSMEVFYYVEETLPLLQHISSWIKPKGYLIFGVDRYLENEESHDWDEKVGCFMALHSVEEWSNFVEEAGFTIVNKWFAAPDEDRGWPGTLAFLCCKP